MKTAMIFASYVTNERALYVGKRFLESFNENFPDADIFVGVNPESLPEWYAEAESVGAQVLTTSDELVIDSDASAFQTALSVFSKCNAEYDLVWFGHTKSATSKNDVGARYQLDEFYGRRAEIEARFENHEVGVFGRDVAILPDPPDNVSSYMIHPPKSKPQPFMILNTFYVCRGELIRDFLDNCKPEFFTQNLGDRYFFERDFYQALLMQGANLSFDQIVQMKFSPWSDVVSDEENYYQQLEEWRKQNGLQKL